MVQMSNNFIFIIIHSFIYLLLIRSAMKVAGHELKSVQRYYGNDGIHVPLMALV